jgi:phage baseplate assembly protein gpV
MYKGNDGSDLIGVIQAIVQNEIAKLRFAEIGVVTELFAHEADSDKNNYACNVRLRDSGLELPKVPVATGCIGQVVIPDIDDLVMVQFVGGDPHGAIITGRLYNDVDRPPTAKAGEFVYAANGGEDSDVRRVYLEFPNGNTVLINDEKIVVEAGETTLTMKNGGEIEIKAAAGVKINSKGATTIKSGGDMTLDSSGALNLKAKTDINIEGLSIAVKGQTSTQVEGQVSTTVKGAILNLSGMTNFSMG